MLGYVILIGKLVNKEARFVDVSFFSKQQYTEVIKNLSIIDSES